MPHLRKRHVLGLVKNSLGFSPIVGLLGHRQVGKTTFLTSLRSLYCTFDKALVLDEARKNPEVFLNSFQNKLLCIDEAQLLPELFPAIKEFVRIHKKPGQFVLSGSVRFTSRKLIKESLTGRIVNWEMLPMVLSEIKGLELSDLFLKILKTDQLGHLTEKFKDEMKLRRSQKDQVALYLKNGGLPGICFLRNEKIMQERIKEQLLTILDRDLRMVYDTTLPYQRVYQFIEELSHLEGEPFNLKLMKDKTGLNEVTQKKLLFALESLFLIRPILMSGDTKKITYYFEDQAEHLLLSGGTLSDDRYFEGLCYRNIRAQFHYAQGEVFKLRQYNTRGGVRIPFAFSAGDQHLGIIPVLTPEPSMRQMAHAKSFLSKFTRSKIIFISKENSFRVMDEKMAVLPSYLV